MRLDSYLNKSITCIMLALMLFTCISVSSFATEEPTIIYANEDLTLTDKTSPFDIVTGDTLDKDMSIDRVNGWIDSKGEDILKVVQKIVQWISTILFGVFLAKALFGLFGRGDMVPQALIGCALSVVVYSAVTYIPIIMESGKIWFIQGL